MHRRFSMAKRLAVMSGGDPWQNVTQPDAAFAFLPFNIQTYNGAFRVDPSFNIQTHAGITVAKSYYVSPGGSDANDGLTSGAPLLNLSTAMGKADVDRIYLMPGWHYRNQSSLANPARNIEFIGLGTVYLSPDWRPNLTFSLVDTHYEAALAAEAYAIMDRSSTDVNGDLTLYTKKASVAEVDAAAGSWFWAKSKLYVHTTGGGAPDANIAVLIAGGGASITSNNRVAYFENINFISTGYCTVLSNTSSVGGLKAYAKNCTYDGVGVATHGFSLNGVTEFIAQGCTIKRTLNDGIRTNALNTVATKSVELDLTIRNCGIVGDTAINASSIHGPSTVVEIGCDYSYTYGAPVMDIRANTYRWAVDCYHHHNLRSQSALDGTGSGFSTGDANSQMWCDTCRSDNNEYDYVSGAVGSLKKRNCTGATSDLGNPGSY